VAWRGAWRGVAWSVAWRGVERGTAWCEERTLLVIPCSTSVPLSEEFARHIICQLVEALDYLHYQKVRGSDVAVCVRALPPNDSPRLVRSFTAISSRGTCC
jgi:hypothetical protein